MLSREHDPTAPSRGRGSGSILVLSDSFPTLAEAVEDLEASGHDVHYVPSLTRFQDLNDADGRALHESEAVITGRVMTIDRDALDRAPRLKVIALHTSGTDNVDVAAASDRGILVTNVKGVNAGACADLAMGLVLATTRQILRGDQELRAGRWAHRMAPSLGLEGALLGVVGLGGIGRALVHRAAAFGMRIVVHTRTEDPEFARRYGIDYLPLDDLLDRSDVVALTASLTSATRGMIGERELRRMKSTAHFVNVARGELVDEAALERVLRDGAIAGAALDVFESEPLTESRLFELDNVVLTPHLAGLTRASMVGAARRAARNALSVLAGDVPEDCVNPPSLADRSAAR